MVIDAGARGRVANDKASILSPVYTNTNNADMCAIFFYYMDGKDMGSLNTYYQVAGGGWKSAFTAKGIEDK